MWVRRIIVSLLLLIGLPLLGIGAGFRLMGAWQNWGADRWQELGRPPVMPIEIVDGAIDEICVRGQDGSLYVCDHNGRTRDNACWEQLDQVGDRYAGVMHETYADPDKIPEAPGAVIDTLDVAFRYYESARFARYVLLEDGSVWLWERHADANFSLALLFAGPICGLALAVVIVSLWWGVAGLRALWRRGKAGTES